MLSAFDLSGRVALVTGGARGIGAAIAEKLAQAGARVLIADRDEVEAVRLGERMQREGYPADAVPLDVTSRASVEAAAAIVAGRYGSLDILVNNAGIVRNAPAVETAEHDWNAVIDVNLNGGFQARRLSAGRWSKPAAARSSTFRRCAARSSSTRSRRPPTTPARRA